MEVGYFKVKSTNQYHPSVACRGIFIKMAVISSKVLQQAISHNS